MRQDNTAHRLATQRRLEKLFPHQNRALGVKPRVNQRPTVALIKGVDIDMIQHHRKRQAYPEHPLGHFDPPARFGRVWPWISYALQIISHATSKSSISRA